MTKRFLAAALCLGVLSVAPSLAAAADPPSPAAGLKKPPTLEPEAMQALEKMSTYLTSLQAFRVTSRTSLDLVTTDGEKLTFDGVVTYKARKNPQGLTIDLDSDLKKRRYIYDGKQFTVFAPEMGFYASVSAPPTIRATLSEISNKYGIELPLEDLFRWSDTSGGRPETPKAGFDVGPATIDGVDTEQYAFRQGDIDWQIWIKEGADPLPLKVVIVDRTDPAMPGYIARLTWDLNPGFTDADFAFQPPKDAKSIRIGVASK
jgi:hypothetical protein